LKKSLQKTALPLLLIVLALGVGCAKFNVPNEELQKAMPKDPSEEMKKAYIKFATVNYKLYSCLVEMDQAFAAIGVPSDPETTGLLLGYAEEFLSGTESALKEISEWAEKNGKKMDDQFRNAADLEKSEQKILIHFMALADRDFQEKQAAYAAAIRVYLAAARREHEFLKEKYEAVILGIGDAVSRYLELVDGLGRTKAARDGRLQDVSNYFAHVLSVKEKSLGLSDGSASPEKPASGILP